MTTTATVRGIGHIDDVTATRTIYLDHRHDPDARKIQVRSGSRHHKEIVLDRYNYLWPDAGKDESRAAPAAFLDAVKYARDLVIDRIWYAGYAGGFFYGPGDGYVNLLRTARPR